MQDEKILDLYWARDESAITETQTKYGKYLTKIAFNILSNDEDTEESVNDTYLAAWNSIPPQRPNVFSAYLSKLIRRISIDIFRKRNREKRKTNQYSISLEELKDCLSNNETPESQLELKLLGKSVNNFLLTLPEESRNLFIGRYYYLDSVKEVARYCGMSESNAKTTLFRIRLALKEYLKKEGFDL